MSRTVHATNVSRPADPEPKFKVYETITSGGIKEYSYYIDNIKCNAMGTPLWKTNSKSFIVSGVQYWVYPSIVAGATVYSDKYLYSSVVGYVNSSLNGIDSI